MPKKRNKRLDGNVQNGESGRRPDSRAVGLLIMLVIVTMTVFALYRFLMDFYYFEIVLIAYMVLATAFVLTYVIYNRGLSRKGITPEMLPDTWSEEKTPETALLFMLPSASSIPGNG